MLYDVHRGVIACYAGLLLIFLWHCSGCDDTSGSNCFGSQGVGADWGLAVTFFIWRGKDRYGLSSGTRVCTRLRIAFLAACDNCGQTSTINLKSGCSRRIVSKLVDKTGVPFSISSVLSITCDFEVVGSSPTRGDAAGPTGPFASSSIGLDLVSLP